MFTLELSSYVLEILNVVYTILSQNLIGGSTVRQNPIQLQVDCMILEKYNEKAPLNINMPYWGGSSHTIHRGNAHVGLLVSV